jgi:exosortase
VSDGTPATPSARRATGASVRRRCGLGPSQLLLAAALVTGAVAATWDAWSDMYHLGTEDPEQSHVLLVPVVAAWLVWVRRERLRRFEPTASWVGPAVVALGWFLNWYGDARLHQSVWHFGAICVAAGAFLTVAGGGFLVRFLPAFLSLCFLVPVPAFVREHVALPLQTATAEVTRGFLETLGVSVGRAGNTLRVNGQDVMIAEACNGLRMVFALFLISFAFAFGTPLRTWVRLLVLAAAPLSAIAFNVVRLAPVVWAFGWTDLGTAEFLHSVSGWVMLPFAFLTLTGLMRALRWARVPISPYVLSYGS